MGTGAPRVDGAERCAAPARWEAMPDWATPFLDAAILLPALIAIVRLAGLRSFAKMSAHDFVVTVATGSVVAATVLNAGTAWWQGLLALVALDRKSVV